MVRPLEKPSNSMEVLTRSRREMLASGSPEVDALMRCADLGLYAAADVAPPCCEVTRLK